MLAAIKAIEKGNGIGTISSPPYSRGIAQTHFKQLVILTPGSASFNEINPNALTRRLIDGLEVCVTVVEEAYLTPRRKEMRCAIGVLRMILESGEVFSEDSIEKG